MRGIRGRRDANITALNVQEQKRADPLGAHHKRLGLANKSFLR